MLQDFHCFVTGLLDGSLSITFLLNAISHSHIKATKYSSYFIFKNNFLPEFRLNHIEKGIDPMGMHICTSKPFYRKRNDCQIKIPIIFHQKRNRNFTTGKAYSSLLPPKQDSKMTYQWKNCSSLKILCRDYLTIWQRWNTTYMYFLIPPT